MQGHPAVIDCLKELLRGELAARDQYFIHSRQYEDQGFVRLYERLNHEMQEETDHADAILRRILLLAQLRDTEQDHAYWLEQQLGLIAKLGLQNYLQSQT